MEQDAGFINEIAKRAVLVVLDDLYSIHRPIALSHAGGVSSTAFAEASGVYSVAMEAIRTATGEARIAAGKAFADIDPSITVPDFYQTLKYNLKKTEIIDAARKGALHVIDAARSKGLLYLRDGTRSATIVLAREIFQSNCDR